jgi:hypothetical protein
VSGACIFRRNQKKKEERASLIPDLSSEFVLQSGTLEEISGGMESPRTRSKLLSQVGIRSIRFANLGTIFFFWLGHNL